MKALNMDTYDRSQYWLSVIVFVMALTPGTMLAQRVVYVDSIAAGANNGSSWTDAYVFLKDALADAQEGEKPVEIHVSQGIYRPYRGEGFHRVAFQLMNNVAIRGGYAGSASPHPDVRDFRLYRTILSGDVLNNDTQINEAIWQREPSREDNSSTIVECSSVEETAILDGCIVQGGHYWSPISRGDGSLELGAGGLRISGGNPTIMNCTFAENRATWGGGGVYVGQGGKPTLMNCLIKLNGSSSDGGGLYVEDGHVHLINCRFEKNGCAQNGGAVYLGQAGTAMITGCYFVANNARNFGGAVADEVGKSVTKRCVFAGNSTYLGWEIWTKNPGMEVENCTFTGNVTRYPNSYEGYGFRYRNCIVWDNWHRPSVFSSNSRFFYSCAPKSYVSASSFGLNTILDTDPLFFRPGYWAESNDPNLPSDPSDPNSIWVDGDYHLKSQAGRYDPDSKSWIQDDVTSPCIDAGDPNSPIGQRREASLSGEPFPNGGRINMGAYGGTAEASKSYFGEPPCETIIAGDINGDCQVDFLDLAILTRHWLREYAR